jgi:hypothetical protein
VFLERNPITGQTLNGVRTDAIWNSSKLLDIEEGPDRKFSPFRRMMLGQSSVWMEYHVVWTNARDPIFLTWNLYRIFENITLKEDF